MRRDSIDPVRLSQFKRCLTGAQRLIQRGLGLAGGLGLQTEDSAPRRPSQAEPALGRMPGFRPNAEVTEAGYDRPEKADIGCLLNPQ